MEPENQKDYRLPDYCLCCKAPLMGAATIHKPECPIQKLIEENFSVKADPEQ